MKAELQNTTVVKLSLTEKELYLIVRGLGKTSERGRMTAGMTPEEAKACGSLYFALDGAIEQGDAV